MYAINSMMDEIPLDRITVSLIITVNGEIVKTIGDVWSNVSSLRIFSKSGMNKDTIIDGDQDILDKLYRKANQSDKRKMLDATKQCGQIAGLRTTRQNDMKDLLTDLLYGRSGTGVTLLHTFDNMEEQRRVLKKFRTDILATPITRLRDLAVGLEIEPLLKITFSDDKKTCTVTPESFSDVRFELMNHCVS
nr:MAG: hypothetical protein [Planococcus ficus-associated reovirus 1]